MFSYKNKANIYNYFNNKGVVLVIMRKVIISLIYVSIVLTIPLAVACQGVNFTYQCYELQR